ncbi:MAG: MFS transporter [Clostridia bacterium]
MRLKRNIWLMYAIALLQGMVFYGPIATLYRQSSGISIFQITIIESISLALCLLLEMPWGIVADKIGYRKTMVFCCWLYFLSKIVFWRATGFLGFLLERIMLSVIIAGLSGVESSILYLSCDKDESQKVFGIYNNLITTGLLLSAAVYTGIASDDYRLSGLLTVVSYGLAALLALGLREVRCNEVSRPSTITEFLALLKQTLKNKHLLLFLIGIALLNETHQTITVFFNQLQYVSCGLSGVSIGKIYIAVTIIGLGGMFSAKLTRRFGVMPLSATLYAIAAASCITLAFTRNAMLSIAAIMLLRLSFSLFQPLQLDLQNKQVATNNRATALSINAVLIDSVGIGTNIIFGKLADADLASAMVFGAGACIVGLVLFAVWYRHYKQKIPR